MTASRASELFPLPHNNGRRVPALALRWDISSSNNQGDP